YHAATSASYSLSLHDALPIYGFVGGCCAAIQTDNYFVHAVDYILRLFAQKQAVGQQHDTRALRSEAPRNLRPVRMLHRFTAAQQDRKSTRLNPSHVKISYAVF